MKVRTIEKETCGHCGGKVSNSADYCQNCGISVDTSTDRTEYNPLLQGFANTAEIVEREFRPILEACYPVLKAVVTIALFLTALGTAVIGAVFPPFWIVTVFLVLALIAVTD